MPKQTVIHALGRSGSTILMDCFNISPLTHCRNEPHSLKIEGAAIRKLELLSKSNTKLSIADCWPGISSSLSSEWSGKDLFNPKVTSKAYFNQQLWNLHIPQLIQNKSSIRKFLSFAYPGFKKKEYKLPSWLYTSEYWTEEAYHVYKTGLFLQPWLGDIFHCDKDVRVIFLVRHPLGYAQSLYQRVFQADAAHFTNLFKQRLKEWLEIARSAGADLPSLDIDALDPFEIILWIWLVSNEAVQLSYGSSDKVMLVVYEELLANPEEVMEKIFYYCEIPWDLDIKNSISYIFSGSAKLAQSFRKRCSPEQIRMAEKILEYSSLGELWNDDLWDRLTALEKLQSQTSVSYAPY